MSSPFPKPGGWIANRVIDGFMNRFFFLLYENVHHGLFGADFLNSFRSYIGILNASCLCGFIFIALRQTRDLWKSSIVCLSFITMVAGSACIRIVFMDSAHTVAYNLSLLVTLAFVTEVAPIKLLFNNSHSPTSEADNRFPLPRYYLLTILSYFTAFSNELYCLFSWIYLLALFMAAALLRNWGDNMNIAAMRRQLSSWARIDLLLLSQFFGFSLLSAYIFSTAGRTAMGIHNSPATTFPTYFFEVIQSLLTNRLSLFILMPIAICLLSHGIYFVSKNVNTKLTRSILGDGETRSTSTSGSIMSVLISSMIINAAYLMCLVVAGFAASRNFLGVEETLHALRYLGPAFHTNRSQLFLSPLIVVNTLVSLWAILIFIKPRVPLLIRGIGFLGALLLALTSMNRVLMAVQIQIRDSLLMSEAFLAAASSSNDKIPIDFCLPTLVTGSEGYPLLPGLHSDEGFRSSYRRLFNQYYRKNFGPAGPSFIPSQDAKPTSWCQ
jgi:hypothetical protein